MKRIKYWEAALVNNWPASRDDGSRMRRFCLLDIYYHTCPGEPNCTGLHTNWGIVFLNLGVELTVEWT